MVAEVDLPEDVGEVLLHPGQRGLPDAVLARGDHHEVAAAAQALQAVVRPCAAAPHRSETRRRGRPASCLHSSGRSRTGVRCSKNGCMA